MPLTTEQQDWNDDIALRHGGFSSLPPKPPVYYELVQRTSKGAQRDSWVEEQTISVHSTELGAYKAGLKPSFVVRPLKVKD